MGNLSSGRGALPLAVVNQVTRLLAMGLNRCQAARRAHVDWKTVDRIAGGHHVSQSQPARHRRCRGCGGMVLMPCRLCRMRALRETGVLQSAIIADE